MGDATDPEIVAWALEHDHVIISSDSDFSAILARQHLAKPSFVLLRHLNELTPEEQADLLIANLPNVTEQLTAGAAVTVIRDRIRVRRLPFRPV